MASASQAELESAGTVPERATRCFVLSTDPAADLQLTPIPPPRPVRWEFSLLAPEQCVTEFVGREQSLRELLGWLDEPWTFSTRVLVGPSGCGKTRLAHELLRGMPPGWQGGLVLLDQMRCGDSNPASRPWRWSSPTLMVIDNAELVGDDLPRWIEAVATGLDLDGPSLRVLLVDREAYDTSGWFSRCRRVWFSPKLNALRLGPLPVVPPPLAELWRRTDRASVYRAARAGGAGLDTLADDKPLEQEATEQFAGETVCGSPLGLMMAGLLSLRRHVDSPSLCDLSELRLAVGVAREARATLIGQRVGDLDDSTPSVVARAIAWITLLSASAGDGLPAHLREFGAELPEYGSSSWLAVELDLRQFLGRSDGSLSPRHGLLPLDAFVLAEFFGELASLDVAALTKVCMDRPSVALRLAGMAGRCYELGAPEAHGTERWTPAVRALSFLAESRTLFSTDVWEILEPLLERILPRPTPPTPLTPDLGESPTASTVFQATLRLLEQHDRWPTVERARNGTADSWRALSPPLQSAVLVMERLRVADPPGYALHRRMWLAELITHRPQVLEPDSAPWELEAARECRQLARTEPDIFLPVLTIALERLCRFHLNHDDDDELAEKSGRLLTELAALQRLLADARPREFYCWPICTFWRSGSESAAAPDCRGSTVWLRDMAQRLRSVLDAPPDAVVDELPLACSGLAAAFFRVGAQEEGVELAETALQVGSQLSHEWPRRFETSAEAAVMDLAISLNGPTGRVSQCDWVRSLERRAVERYHDLAKRAPSRHLVSLAEWGTLLARRLADDGRELEALTLLRDTVGWIREIWNGTHPNSRTTSNEGDRPRFGPALRLTSPLRSPKVAIPLILARLERQSCVESTEPSEQLSVCLDSLGDLADMLRRLGRESGQSEP